METEQTYIPISVKNYVCHRLQGDRCGEISPDLRHLWQEIKTLPHYPNNTDWAEVVAEWDNERFTTDLDTEVERLRSIISRHWEQAEEEN